LRRADHSSRGSPTDCDVSLCVIQNFFFFKFRSVSSLKKNFTGHLSATFVTASEFIILWWGKEELHLLGEKSLVLRLRLRGVLKCIFECVM